jgi:hypothetical protein
MSILKSERSYLAWALVFGYILVDDSFSIHEGLGERVADGFNFAPILGIRAVDLGEIAVSAMVGSGLLLAVGAAYRWGSETFRGVSRILLVMLGGLVFFGVVVDVVHEMVGHGWIYPIVGGIEDGGEMMVMSVICAYTLGVLLASRKRDGDPHVPVAPPLTAADDRPVELREAGPMAAALRAIGCTCSALSNNDAPGVGTRRR